MKLPDFNGANSLEDSGLGIPLWKAEEADIGAFYGTSTSNNAPVFAPNVNITVNGGGPNAEQNFRQVRQKTHSDFPREHPAHYWRL